MLTSPRSQMKTLPKGLKQELAETPTPTPKTV
jgi:hypothetical protein